MLYLTRRPHQAIFIKCSCGENIELLVQRINRNQVMLAFDADPAVKIHRDDMKRRKDYEQDYEQD